MAVGRIRVLILINCYAGQGGAERFAHGLVTHLPRDRVEPWVCFTRGADPEPLRELAELGIPFTSVLRRARWDVHRLARLVPLLRNQSFDVIHAHMFGSNLWGTLFGRACSVPVVIAHEQTWAYRGNPLRAALDGLVIGRLATRFIAVSQADADRMVSYERVPAGKVMVIPNAYVPRRHDGHGDIRRELGLPPGTPLIATGAVMRPQKALEVLIEAHALVLQRVPEAHLVLAGDGPRREAVQQRANELGIADRTHLVGMRTDVDAIVAAADVAALSSDFEGMPLFAFETAANATPLVSTAVGALPELLEDGESALLVPPRDPRALADGLVRLLQDAELRGAIAAAAQRRLAPHTIDAVAAGFADLYERLLDEARR